MTSGLNAIDNNIIWEVRNAEPGTPGQRGCAGSGIFENAASNLVIAHNLIGHCDNAGVFTTVRPDRGRPVADGNQVTGNIFAKCKAGIVFLSTNNRADANVYVDMPGAFQGLLDAGSGLAGDSDAWRHVAFSDLASWRAAHGWEPNSVIAAVEIRFDADALKLSISAPNPLPRASAEPWMQADMQGKPTGSTRPAGPLADIGAKQVRTVDPRRPSVADAGL
jgi:hypothetical protein